MRHVNALGTRWLASAFLKFPTAFLVHVLDSLRMLRLMFDEHCGTGPEETGC